MSGLIASLFQKRSLDLSKTTAREYGDLWGYTVDAGVSVTPESSMKYSAVYACVSILSQTLASLPLVMYKRQDRGKSKAPAHYMYRLLHDKPNEMMTSFELRGTLQAHLALWGNAYSWIDYDQAGRVTRIYPLRPDGVLQIDTQGNMRRYQYQWKDGTVTWLNGMNVWHLRGMGSDGLYGYSPIQLMRNSIGLGMAAEKYGSKFFSNNARPGGLIEHPGKLSDLASKNLKASWDETHAGLDNAHRVAILEEGMKWHETGIPPQDAQYLETRRFQIEEIARIYRIPPHMLADLERATFSNVEQLGINFVVHTIRPWLVMWEQSINENLLLEKDRKNYYAEFVVDALLRGDTNSRYSAYATARQNGWMSANDIRELENMNPVEGGDVYLVPLNMVPATQVGQNQAQNPPQNGQNQAANDLNPPQTRDYLPQNLEKRGRENAGQRYKLIGRQQRVFGDATKRIIRRERNDVGAQAKKMLGAGKQDAFEKWLTEFYDQHANWSAEQMLPLMMSYAETVSDAVGEELSMQDLASKVENFTRQYATDYGKRQAARSLTSLVELLRKTAKMNADEQVGEFEDRLDSWMDTRPDSIAHEESVRLNNAVAIALYGIVGIKRLMSIATGESTCPYCSELDGMTIGIDEFFLKAGQELQPPGAAVPLTSAISMRHAPFHGGCDCVTISA